MEKQSRFQGGVAGRSRWVLVAAAVLAAASAPALATDPTLPAIDFPIDNASVVTAVATAGAAILLLVVGLKIAFSLTRRFVGRVAKAV